MEEERKIKDIYNCNYILDDGELYPLQKWYNEVLDKRISDINVFDVLRMIRQNEFLDIALPKAIEYLKDNPFIGDMYEGEMLEKLSEMDISFLETKSNEIKVILLQALDQNNKYEWLCEEERKEFGEMIDKQVTKHRHQKRCSPTICPQLIQQCTDPTQAMTCRFCHFLQG